MTNSKVSIATLARTAALAFALANQVSSAAGKPPAAHRKFGGRAVCDHWTDHCHQRRCVVEEQQLYRRRHRRRQADEQPEESGPLNERSNRV